MQGTRQRLEAILRERIAVLDGSWGVLIQRELRGEEAYRGERFRDHSHDVAGDPDLLNITRPEVVTRIHEDYFAAHPRQGYCAAVVRPKVEKFEKAFQDKLKAR